METFPELWLKGKSLEPLKSMFKRLYEADIEMAPRKPFTFVANSEEEEDYEPSNSVGTKRKSEESTLDHDQDVCHEECAEECLYGLKRQRALSGDCARSVGADEGTNNV